MPTEQARPKLQFVSDFTEKDALDAHSRGYLSHVFVELDRGRVYPVFFYDPVRLHQDSEESAKHGRPFIADPGMIVVAEITLDEMARAVQQLSQEGFFDRLTAMTREDLAAGDPYCWPPPLPRKDALEKAKTRQRVVLS